MKSILKLLLLSVFLVFFYSSKAQNEASNNVSKYLQEFLSDITLKNASVGFVMTDTTGEMISFHNPDISLIPASVTKLITTASALEILGADYTYKTSVLYTGKIKNDTLYGDVIIKGGGDPALGSELFEEHYGEIFKKPIEKLKELNVKHVTGNVIADESCFDLYPIPPTWIWGDIGNYFGAAPGGLSIFDNTYKINFDTGKNPGDKTTINHIYPSLEGVDIKNYVTSSADQGDNSYIYGSPYSGERIIRGTLPINRKGFVVKGAIPDPALFAAKYFRQELGKAGINSGNALSFKMMSAEEIEILKKEDVKEVFTIESPPIKEIVKYTNTKSINLFAEHLGLTIAKESGAEEVTVSAGVEIITAFWEEKGLDINGMHLCDASGLSRYNVFTPRQLVFVIKYMLQESENAGVFEESLAIAGETGTLSGMLKGTYAEGKLKAKSGYLTRVRSYAGTVKSKSGKKLYFTVMVNNYNCTAYRMKKKIEKLLEEIAIY